MPCNAQRIAVAKKAYAVFSKGIGHKIRLISLRFGRLSAIRIAQNISMVLLALAFATRATCVEIAYYTPVAGDNGAAFQAAVNSAASQGLILQLPCNTTVQWGGYFSTPSHAHVNGCGRYSSILQKTPGSAATTFIGNDGPISDVSFTNLGVDGQGSTIPSAFYPFVFQRVSGLTIKHSAFFNPYGTVFYLYEDDTSGAGPGGRPLPPDGQQFNSNVDIEDNDFSGVGAVTPVSDLADFLRIVNLRFVNNRIDHGGATCFGFQFNINFVIEGNHEVQCWRGIYTETVAHGTIRDNDWMGVGTPASVIGDVPAVGIWAADANQTYPGGGYNGTHDVLIEGNHAHDVQRTSGASGVKGIWITGPGAALPSSNVNVSNNDCYNLNGGGGGRCVEFAGYQVRPIGNFNTASNTDVAMVPSAPYQTPGYPLTQATVGPASFLGNSPNQSGPAVTSFWGLGSGSSVSMGSGARDDSGTINITAGSGAGATGNIGLQMDAAIGGGALSCVANGANGSGAWSPVISIAAAGGGSLTMNWKNATSLAPATYAIHYHCSGN